MPANHLYKKIIRKITYGLLESIIIIILYIYILPTIITQLYSQMGAQGIPVPTRGPVYYAVLGTVLGLGIAARTLEGTIFRPILSASANLIGLLYAFTFFGTGIISASNIQVSSYTVSFSLDATPLILVFFAFFGAPSIILPFIEYFYNNK